MFNLPVDDTYNTYYFPSASNKPNLLPNILGQLAQGTYKSHGHVQGQSHHPLIHPQPHQYLPSIPQATHLGQNQICMPFNVSFKGKQLLHQNHFEQSLNLACHDIT